jgi:hypothetical protein
MPPIEEISKDEPGTFGLNLDAVEEPGELNRYSDNLTRLAEYARWRARMVECRRAGRMKSALAYERKCDALYVALDPEFKW